MVVWENLVVSLVAVQDYLHQSGHIDFFKIFQDELLVSYDGWVELIGAHSLLLDDTGHKESRQLGDLHWAKFIIVYYKIVDFF